MTDIYLSDTIEPCPGCGGKKFSLIFHDGSDLTKRQANDRCNDCGKERPSDQVPSD